MAEVAIPRQMFQEILCENRPMNPELEADSIVFRAFRKSCPDRWRVASHFGPRAEVSGFQIAELVEHEQRMIAGAWRAGAERLERRQISGRRL
jgi:hypothetical protein